MGGGIAGLWGMMKVWMGSSGLFPPGITRQWLTEATSLLQAVPGVPPCPATLNPATWMLDISTAGEEQRLGINWADVHDQSALCK